MKFCAIQNRELFIMKEKNKYFNQKKIRINYIFNCSTYSKQVEMNEIIKLVLSTLSYEKKLVIYI